MTRLRNQTHGPVTLAKIDVAFGLSEETFAFTAEVRIGQLRSTVRNAGHGGDDVIASDEAFAALAGYCRTLEPATSLGVTIKYCPDYLISTMISAAAKQHGVERVVRRYLNKAPASHWIPVYLREAPKLRTPDQWEDLLALTDATAAREALSALVRDHSG